MRVMVTGATTPLGAAIVRELLADADVTRVLAIGLEAQAASTDPRLVYRATDLTRPREVHDLIHGAARQHAIDTIVHAAQHRDAHDGDAAFTRRMSKPPACCCSTAPTIQRFADSCIAASRRSTRNTTPRRA